MAFLRMALRVCLISAILAQATALKQYWPSHFALGPILLSGGHLGPILHSKSNMAGHTKKAIQ